MKIQCGGQSPFIGGASLSHACRTFYPFSTVPTISLRPPQPAQLTTNKVRLTLRLTSKVNFSTTTNKFRPSSRLSLFLYPTYTAYTSPNSSRFSTKTTHYAPAIMGDPKWTGVGVRKTFLEFFEKRGHTIGMRQHNAATQCFMNFMMHLYQYFDMPLHNYQFKNTNLLRFCQCPHRPLSLTMTPPCSSPMRA